MYFHCELSGPGMGWGGCPLPHSSSLFLHPRHTPTLQPRKPLSQDPLSLSVFPVKVPTRRTFMDPQSCGDPLQAVHLFAKELDAKSVTVEKSLGAGKLATQGALSLGGTTSALAPPPLEVPPQLHPLGFCKPASTPRPSESRPMQTAVGRRADGQTGRRSVPGLYGPLQTWGPDIPEL